MSNLLTRILKIADYPRPFFSGDDAERHSVDEIAILEKHNFLRPLPTATVVDCHECGEYEPVFFREIQGTLRAFSSCRQGGLQTIPWQRLRSWEISHVGIMDWLGEVLNVSGTRTELVAGRIWRLGRCRHGARQALLFSWGLQRSDMIPLLQAHEWYGRTFLLVPEQPPQFIRLPADVTIIPLVSVVRMEGERLVFDEDFLTAVSSEPGVTSAPPRKRSQRTAMIEALRRVLMEHIRATREQLLFQDETGQELVPLPRPTRRQLAKELGANELNVGRCLSDPAATELRFLWDLAADTERLRDYSLAVR